jgi:hypothetical protein
MAGIAARQSKALWSMRVHKNDGGQQKYFVRKLQINIY